MVHSSCDIMYKCSCYYVTPLIPAAYGGRYRSTFAFLLLHVLYVHIYVSMRYTGSCSFIYIDVTGYSMYTFLLWYYILCIFNISPQSVVNLRFTIFSANRHTKFHMVCGTMWFLHIYIFFIQNTGYFGSHK